MSEGGRVGRRGMGMIGRGRGRGKGGSGVKGNSVIGNRMEGRGVIGR